MLTFTGSNLEFFNMYPHRERYKKMCDVTVTSDHMKEFKPRCLHVTNVTAYLCNWLPMCYPSLTL